MDLPASCPRLAEAPELRALQAASMCRLLGFGGLPPTTCESPHPCWCPGCATVCMRPPVLTPTKCTREPAGGDVSCLLLARPIPLPPAHWVHADCSLCLWGLSLRHACLRGLCGVFAPCISTAGVGQHPASAHRSLACVPYVFPVCHVFSVGTCVGICVSRLSCRGSASHICHPVSLGCLWRGPRVCGGVSVANTCHRCNLNK